MRCELKILLLGFVVCFSINLVGCSKTDSTAQIEAPPPPPPGIWELPEGMDVDLAVPNVRGLMPSELNVSPTGNYIGFTARPPKSKRVFYEYTLLNTHSGEIQSVLDICAAGGTETLDIGKHKDQFSRNGETLLVNSRQGRAVTKINLATGQATNILETPSLLCDLTGWWFGDNVASAIAETPGKYAKTHPVRIVSSEGASIRTLPVHGEILAADRAGRFLVLLADPNHLSKSMAWSSLKPHILVVDAEGKILRDLGARNRFNPLLLKIVLSPNGSYLAFTLPRTQKEEEEGKTTIRVISPLDGGQRSVISGTLITVTDEGELLTWETVGSVSDVQGTPTLKIAWVFKFFSANGKEEVLFGSDSQIMAATIANHRLYYVSMHGKTKYKTSCKKFR